jgi:hypothetical protein
MVVLERFEFVSGGNREGGESEGGNSYKRSSPAPRANTPAPERVDDFEDDDVPF